MSFQSDVELKLERKIAHHPEVIHQKLHFLLAVKTFILELTSKPALFACETFLIYSL